MKTIQRSLLACISTLLLASSAVTAVYAETPDPALAHAKELLKKAILIDGHNDAPWAIRIDKKAPTNVDLYDLRNHPEGQTDIPRLRAGGVGAQFWSVYTPGEAPGNYARTQLEQIDIARRMIARYPDALVFARTAADIRAAHKNNKIASLL